MWIFFKFLNDFFYENRYQSWIYERVMIIIWTKRLKLQFSSCWFYFWKHEFETFWVGNKEIQTLSFLKYFEFSRKSLSPPPAVDNVVSLRSWFNLCCFFFRFPTLSFIAVAKLGRALSGRPLESGAGVEITRNNFRLVKSRFWQKNHHKIFKILHVPSHTATQAVESRPRLQPLWCSVEWSQCISRMLLISYYSPDESSRVVLSVLLRLTAYSTVVPIWSKLSVESRKSVSFPTNGSFSSRR